MKKKVVTDWENKHLPPLGCESYNGDAETHAQTSRRQQTPIWLIQKPFNSSYRSFVKGSICVIKIRHLDSKAYATLTVFFLSVSVLIIVEDMREMFE